jgi:hypothetical protein
MSASTEPKPFYNYDPVADSLDALFFETDPPTPVAEAYKIVAKLGCMAPLADLEPWRKERIWLYMQKLVKKFASFLRRVMPEVSADEFRQMVIQFVMMHAVASQDGKLALAAVDREQAELDGQRKNRGLDQKDAEFEFKKSLKDIHKAGKKRGGLSRETLEKIERELKLF